MVKIRKKHVILISVTAVLVAILIAVNVLASIFWGHIMYVFGKTDVGGGDTTKVEGAVTLGDEQTQSTAEDAMVLLKNKKDVNGKASLPLAKEKRKVNLFGYGVTDAGMVWSGGGAGRTFLNQEVRSKYTRNLVDAFKEEGFECNESLIKLFDDYSDYWMSRERGIAKIVCPPSSYFTADVLRSAKQFSDTAVVIISRNGSESVEIPLNQPKDGKGVTDDKTRTYLQLTKEEEEMLDVVSDNFENVIVLLNSTNRMECGFFNDDRIDAAIYMGAPGQSGTLAIPRFLKGYKTVKDKDGKETDVAITPSGKLSDTYAYSTRDYDPTNANMFPVDENGKHKGTWSDITYTENIYVGYRWYETADAEGYFKDVDNKYGKGYNGVVQYPFGYGLSYTDFSWEVKELSVENGGDFDKNTKFTVKVRVTNTGDVAGKDVVELYGTPPYIKGGIEKSEINLVAFAKTKQLDPGEYQDVELKFTAYDLASYDAYDKNSNGHAGYELDAGDYKLSLRTDAHTLKDCEQNVITYKLPATANIDKDPVTGTNIVNKFTGSTAFMGVPIDASTLNNAPTYLSRANFAATFPKQVGAAHRNEAVCKEVNEAWNTRYDTDKMPTTDKESNLRFVTKEDGSNASLSDLKGGTKVKLKYNEELMLRLGTNYDDPDWEKILDQMSLNELRDIVYGGGFQTAAVESIGKPKTTDTDGTSGIRYGNDREEVDKLIALPSESLVGCCWNPEIAYNIGRSTGVVANALGMQGWYAPGLNLHRNAYSARYYEYYSEDIVLTGKLGAEVIRGSKNMGLTCYMKHFAVSEEGINPDNVMTWHTEQMLREVYLKPFEIAVKEGGANGIMTCFNCIGAVWAGACDPMNNDILREEWGFEGALLSDWSSGRPFMNVEQAIRGGNDFMLDPGNNGGSSSMNIKNATTASRCRVSAHNILYMWANSWATAKDYAENGEDDRYSVDLGVAINEFPFSPVPIVLLTLIDVLLVGGIAVCVVFTVKKPKAAKEE